MTRLKLRLGRLLPLGVLLGLLSSAIAAPVEDSEEDASANMLKTQLARAFRLSKELPLDPSLRVEAEKISAAHLARMSQLLRAWLQEEARLNTKGTGTTRRTEIRNSVFARLLNELALWQIEPGDVEYEKATLAVVKSSPAVCEIHGDAQYYDFASRILRVQAMPPAQRQAAFATERSLLERWGKPRPAVLPWPNPLPQDAGMLAIARIGAGGTRPPLALAPHLASELLSKGTTYNDLAWQAKCNFQQWWLRVSLAQGSTPAAALSAFRYATMITATKRFGRLFETDDDDASKAESTTTFPKMAAYFGVTGMTTITRRLDASGKPEYASVTDRKIEVPGIRGTRPIAFEDSFDALSVRHALNEGNPAQPGKTLPPVFQLVWKLDSLPAAGTQTKTSQQGGSQ